MRKLLVALLLLSVVGTARAEPVLRFAAAGNAIWIDDDIAPNDFEVGATGRASLSPHISLVGSGLYGIENSYMRGTAGLRFTATDATNPNFSVGFGASRQFSNDTAIRPDEFQAETAIGWRPWPNSNPKVILGVGASYGFDSNQAAGMLGLRYVLGSQSATGAQ